jgi:hypothetical protein
MMIKVSGLKAWIYLIVIIAIAILFLVFIFNLILLLLPFIIILIILFWLLGLLKRKGKKGYVDVEFKVK